MSAAAGSAVFPRPAASVSTGDAGSGPARRLLSFGQVRRRLGVSRVTLWGWIAEGRFPRHTHELPEIKSQTQRRRWDVAVVNEWTEARRLRA